MPLASSYWPFAMVFWLLAAARLDRATRRSLVSEVVSAVARLSPFLTAAPTATSTVRTDHVPLPPPVVLLPSLTVGAVPKSRSYVVARARLPLATTVSATLAVVADAVRYCGWAARLPPGPPVTA